LSSSRKNLTRREDFALCLRNKIYEDDDFKVFFVDDSSKMGGAFWGVFFTRKRIRKSVHRNRIRRLMREFFRRYMPEGGCVLIMPLKENIYRLKYQDFEKLVLNVLEKAGVNLVKRNLVKK